MKKCGKYPQWNNIHSLQNEILSFTTKQIKLGLGGMETGFKNYGKKTRGSWVQFTNYDKYIRC